MVVVGVVLGVVAACGDNLPAARLVSFFENPSPHTMDWYGRTLVGVGNNLVVGSESLDDGGVRDSGYAELRDATTGTLIRTLARPLSIRSGQFAMGILPMGDRFVITSWGTPPAVHDSATGELLHQVPAIAGFEIYYNVVTLPAGFAVVAQNDQTELVTMHDVTGSEMARLLPPDAGDRFGRAIAMTAGRIAVSAPYAPLGALTEVGAVHLYDVSGAHVGRIDPPVARAKQYFGVQLAAIGDRFVIVSFGNPSETFLYAASGALIASTPGSGDIVVVGDNYTISDAYTGAGSVRLFDGTTGRLIQQIPNPRAAGQLFGRVQPVDNGNFVVDAGFDTVEGLMEAGAAYLFDGKTGAMLAELVPPTRAAGDTFAGTVAAAGDWIVVCAAGATRGGVQSVGRVFLFSASTGAYVGEAINPEPDVDDLFGHLALAVLPDRIAIAAINDSVNGVVDAGTVYLFDPAGQ